jgi:hypothetical protein
VADVPLLINELADRYREILPSDGFSVDVQGGRLCVRVVAPERGAGSALTGPGLLTLKLPLPSSLRLRVFFEDEARGLQNFVSRSRPDWPAPGAKPHARVTDREVHVWYGGADEVAAVLRWRPFNRSALGL